MRKHKYRAWDKENKVWVNVEGFLCKEGKITHIITDDRCEYELKYFKLVEFTGLNDKNGFEIFEGDMVSNDLKEKGIVKWEGIGFNWGNNFSINKGDTDEIEVIGNIYENPELLKVAN